MSRKFASGKVLLQLMWYNSRDAKGGGGGSGFSVIMSEKQFVKAP